MAVIRISEWSSRRDATLKIALHAESLLKSGAPRGIRKKLDAKEAAACARMVTEVITRHGLQPTSVLQRDGRTSSPGSTYPFFLTPREMKDPSSLDPEKRRLSRSFASHLESLRLVKAAAGDSMNLEEAICMLSERLPRFLSQFEESLDQDVCEALSRDINRLPDWIGRPARGFDLKEYLSDMARNGLFFDGKTGEAHEVGPGYEFLSDIWPEVHLKMIPVGIAKGILAHDVSVRPKAGLCLNGPDLVEIGEANAVLAERVSVRITLSEGGQGLRTVFVFQPVTLINGSVSGEAPESLQGLTIDRHPVMRMTLKGDPIDLGDIRTKLFFNPIDVTIFDQSFLEHHALVSEEAWVAGPYKPRFIPVTEKSVSRIFDDQPFPEPVVSLKSCSFPMLSEVQGIGARSCPLDRETEREALSKALYDPSERGIPDLLLEKARKRVSAWEAHVSRTREGNLSKRFAFRARMRE